ncbi:MAG TPA: N-acetyltransferase [Trebonia sp.]
MKIAIRAERPADLDAVRRVHTAAFADDGLVADLVASLRSTPAVLAPVSFVAVSPQEHSPVPDAGDGAGQVVGHVMLSASRLDAPSRLVDVYVLSPLGVLPEFQRQGIGTALIRHALAAAGDLTAPLVFLEGSPDYYGKRGFERAGDLGFRRPSLRIPAAAFQVARMPGYAAWMTGTLVYSEPFWAHDCVGLREPSAAPPAPE